MESLVRKMVYSVGQSKGRYRIIGDMERKIEAIRPNFEVKPIFVIKLSIKGADSTLMRGLLVTRKRSKQSAALISPS